MPEVPGAGMTERRSVLPPRRRGPIPRPVGVLVEPVYRAVVGRRNRGFDDGKRVTTLKTPVISVGNLSVGGTGKTPMVMHLVTVLRDAWRTPIVAMRGYKARDGRMSDEQAVYLDRFPDLAIVAQPDRIAGLRRARRTTEFDCIILDDGFQHRFIARDLDIVMIDATRDPFADRCLPAGWLREPVTSLARAQVAVITHAERVPDAAVDRLTERLRGAMSADALIAVAEHGWGHLRIGDQRDAVAWLARRSVVVACGIGNPRAFVEQVVAAGARVERTEIVADHHAWTEADLRRLAGMASGADALVVTEKDWVKLREVAGSVDLPCPVVRPALELVFRSGADLLQERVVEATRPRSERPRDARARAC